MWVPTASGDNGGITALRGEGVPCFFSGSFLVGCVVTEDKINSYEIWPKPASTRTASSRDVATNAKV